MSPSPDSSTGPRVALKVDVCTLQGLRRGAPRLLEVFEALGIRASFFVALGPDRSGRAVLRALRPGVLAKLIRTRALSLYGWRTVLSGTLLPAARPGRGDRALLAEIRARGHELGLHGWDHRLWQDRIESLPVERAREEVDRAFTAFAELAGEPARAFAAPAWTASAAALDALEARGLEYTSNTRLGRPFLPAIDGRELATPEVPSTLPCPEEMLAASLSREPYTGRALPLDLEHANVFPVHAEFEGSPRYAPAFRRWLHGLLERGAAFQTLRDTAREARARGELPRRGMARVRLPGRPGTVLTGWPEEAGLYGGSADGGSTDSGGAAGSRMDLPQEGMRP